MEREIPRLVIIVPCYNEEAVLPVTAPQFLEELKQLQHAKKITGDSRVLFVDDGSCDRTWETIEKLAQTDAHFLGIAQSRNRGHQNALLAGLMTVMDIADVAISIDCDGQDDIKAMEEMIDAYRAGADVVYGVRSDRSTDTWFKRMSAQAFYRFLRFMGAEVVYNHADYRLVSACVIQHFADFHEVNIFLRGMFPLVGFQSTCVPYERHERIAGESHYPLRKMLALAIDGITSLSVRPITIISELGALISLLGFIGILWATVNALLGITVQGWASTICLVCFLGGIQLLSIGIIGTYVGKTYLEAKHRPRYIISKRTTNWNLGTGKESIK